MRKLIHKLIVCIVSLVLVAGILGVVFLIQTKRVEEEQQQRAAQEEAMKETAKTVMTEDEIQALYKEHRTESIEEIEADDTEADSTEEEPDYESPIDWEGMWEINEDVYAWITVPGTVIDYPILQHETDNTYYLNYNIDGSYGFPGCIYTENMNAKDFSDNNTVIYGHNMKNGTMFAGLHQYKDREFFEEHSEVVIYTPQREYRYTIFAAYIYDDRHLLYSFDFENEDVYTAYLDNITNMRDLSANISDDIEVTSEDKIITLATCISSQPDNRLLVQAVLHE